MCAQGDSAGSAAVVYSMTYYGAASYLYNVELISGPVLSDIKQGCQEPAPNDPVTVCPAGQNGLSTWNGGDLHGPLSLHIYRVQTEGLGTGPTIKAVRSRPARPQARLTQRGFSRAL